MKCYIKLDKDKIDDFLIEFDAHLEVLVEEGMLRYKEWARNK